ncbi:MAG: bis(5'-nucleosyl)-tetraphosphatase (symmetrical) YqeK [Chloroflexi bacterium]|nr:bis(5'-nucleosyl)-tetraphosphatase (symmetrical) YqeK [Chloroflexota bacterium]MCH8348821.1 bis(5'-nucleosyl)-tetraphosphatase (symmetrical) YqeK [Chloroflexota bacterium]MCI0779836.1 bis(5'-nucleosyl)-tetraphosphatase (symmetrical) YqeK [Chloroflexota bacterium]MCI0785664.1 bis(5'-nucleosyl)-tetraphosphatase (symmetrical) YqeK [Chloroflexota bacterium]MCI0792074.1 bis(5'-nucleosyl)-tetraphosphatase (symmetrical) YqeK [Chloroflexota bacterium]
MEKLALQIQSRVNKLPPGLQAHINRVSDIARELAPHHGVDPDRAALGMLAHDVARAMPNQELLRHAAEFNLPVTLVERQMPVMLHGPVGAEILQREDGLTEEDLYQAVYWHTTGHPSLDRLGKVVFLADKLDPLKISRYPYLPFLRELALEDLDRAILEFLSRETVARATTNEMVHPATVETRNHLLAISSSTPASTSQD